MRRAIERFLGSNSALVPSNVTSAQAVRVDARSYARPDKIFGATSGMKWAMILNGIDSPYEMAKGRVLGVPDSASLSSELAELEDFEI